VPWAPSERTNCVICWMGKKCNLKGIGSERSWWSNPIKKGIIKEVERGTGMASRRISLLFLNRIAYAGRQVGAVKCWKRRKPRFVEQLRFPAICCIRFHFLFVFLRPTATGESSLSLPGTNKKKFEEREIDRAQGNRKNASNFSAIKRNFASDEHCEWKLFDSLGFEALSSLILDSTEKSALILLCSNQSTKTNRKSRIFTTITIIKLEKESVEFHVRRRTKRVNFRFQFSVVLAVKHN
jgi:hypothetical protein